MGISWIQSLRLPKPWAASNPGKLKINKTKRQKESIPQTPENPNRERQALAQTIKYGFLPTNVKKLKPVIRLKNASSVVQLSKNIVCEALTR